LAEVGTGRARRSSHGFRAWTGCSRSSPSSRRVWCARRGSACGRSSAPPACCRAEPCLQEVAVIGGALAAGALGRLERRPAQQRRAPRGELAWGPSLIRLRDGDIEPARRTAWREEKKRRASPSLARIATLVSLPMPKWPCKAPAAALAAAEGAQLRLERRELLVDVVDHGQRGGDHGACQIRQLEPGELSTASRRQQARGLGHSVMEELHLNALLPGGALVDKRLGQPHLGAQLDQVLGWNSGLRRAALEQQVAQVAGVEAVRLGPPLAAAQPPGSAGSAR
jgi:hypothetical protein